MGFNGCTKGGKTWNGTSTPLYPVLSKYGNTTTVRVLFTSRRGYEASLPTKDYWGYPYSYEWELDEEPSEGWLPITVHAPEDIRSYLKLAQE